MATRVSVPKGTRDFLPQDVLRRRHVIEVIQRVYQRHGFAPLETPAIENLSVLMGKYGEEGDKLLFKILKRGAKAATGEADLGLRYDLTVPLARAVAMHRNELPRVFKRYQIQPVWRADRPGKGRFREFYQCDIDVIGGQAPLSETDLLSAVVEVFDELGFDGTTLRINDRRVLKGLVTHAGVPEELETSAIIAIDKLDKIGLEGVSKELSERGVETTVASKLLQTMRTLRGAKDALAMQEGFLKDLPEAMAGLASLRQIVEGLEAYGVSRDRLKVDPFLARGLDYYTGAIFEVTVNDLSGSLAGGGRYDTLIGSMLGQDVMACGISLGLERILVVMEARRMFPELQQPADVMIADFGPDTRLAALKLAGLLRKAGLSVDLFPLKTKLAKQFKYANSQGIPFVAVIGTDEAEANAARLKDMKSGEQEVVPFDECADWLKV